MRPSNTLLLQSLIVCVSPGGNASTAKCMVSFWSHFKAIQKGRHPNKGISICIDESLGAVPLGRSGLAFTVWRHPLMDAFPALVLGRPTARCPRKKRRNLCRLCSPTVRRARQRMPSLCKRHSFTSCSHGLASTHFPSSWTFLLFGKTVLVANNK